VGSPGTPSAGGSDLNYQPRPEPVPGGSRLLGAITGSAKELKDKGSTRVLAMGVMLAMSLIFSSLICLGTAARQSYQTQSSTRSGLASC
jgi:hypothetical protein